MRNLLMFFAALSVLLGIFFVRDSDAAIYKYVDKDGVVCFADDLQVVPEQYRAAAVIVEGGSKEDVEKSSDAVANRTEEGPAAVEPAGKPGDRSPWPLSVRLLISGTVGFSALMIFFFIRKQPELKENKKVLSIIRGSLVGVVSLYLVFAHVKDVMTIFGIAGKAIDEVQHRSAEKGKKAAQAIKSLDALFEQAQKAQEASTAEPADTDK